MAPNPTQNVRPISGMWKNNPVTLDKLPKECIDTILDNLSPQDLLSVGLVSKHLHGFTDRAIRRLLEIALINVGEFPSASLHRYGSSIKRLNLEHLECFGTVKVMREVCELCPNITELSLGGLWGICSKNFTQPYFIKMLSQLQKLSIRQLIYPGDLFKSQGDLKAALKCCKNLTTLSLGRCGGNYYYQIRWNFEIFFQVVFPKLRTFEINFDRCLSNGLFTNFLRSNSTIKLLWIQTKDTFTDLSGIFQLNQLEALTLISNDNPYTYMMIPQLYRLSELRCLSLTTAFSRDVFERFYCSFGQMTNLRKLIITLADNGLPRCNAFLNDDLFLLKLLPSLTTFHLITQSPRSLTSVKLSGVLETLELCPNLTDIYIAGLHRADNFLGEHFKYGNLNHAYKQKKGRDILMEYHPRLFITWVYFGEQAFNMIDMYKRCSVWD